MIKRILLLVILTAIIQNAYSQGSELIAHYIRNDIADIPNSYLDHIQREGYKYLLAHGNSLAASSGTADWQTTNGNPNGFYNWNANAPQRLYRSLRDLFERADQRNIQVIVHFNLGAPSATTWGVTNTNIEFNNTGASGDGRAMAIMSPDPTGMDRSYESYLHVIFRAFRDANIKNRDLRYIHIGHDEMVDMRTLQYYIAASCQRERDWLDNWVTTNGGTYQDAYCELIANEIARRVNTLRNIRAQYNQTTQAIVYADMFDPEGNGRNGNGFTAWARNAQLNEVQVVINTSGVINRQTLQSVSNDLVLNPWQYSRTYADNYDAAATLRFFRDRGFRVIPGSAYRPIPVTEDSRQAMREWIRVSSLSEFNNTVIGQAAFNWWDYGSYWNSNPRAEVFNILNDLTNLSPVSPQIITPPDPNLTIMADVNGDDRSDIVNFRNNGVYVSTANSDGISFNKWTIWTTEFAGSLGWGSECPRLLGDVNGDGRADVVGFANRVTIVGLSTGSSFTTSQWTTDFCYNLGWRVNTTPRLLGDVNGDGRADVVGFANGGTIVGLSTGSSFTTSQWTSDFCYNLGWRVNTHPRLLGDVNGDGRADVVGFANGGTIVGLSTGSSFTTSQWTSDFCYNLGWRVNTTPRYLGDANGDGRTDVIGFANGGIVVGISSGSSFSSSMWNTGLCYNDGWRVNQHPRMVTSVNRDYRADIVAINGSGQTVTLVSNGSSY